MVRDTAARRALAPPTVSALREAASNLIGEFFGVPARVFMSSPEIPGIQMKRRLLEGGVRG